MGVGGGGAVKCQRCTCEPFFKAFMCVHVCACAFGYFLFSLSLTNAHTLSLNPLNLSLSLSLCALRPDWHCGCAVRLDSWNCHRRHHHGLCAAQQRCPLRCTTVRQLQQRQHPQQASMLDLLDLTHWHGERLLSFALLILVLMCVWFVHACAYVCGAFVGCLDARC